MQLIVLGMHRSGTSAVTRLLNMAGAYFGPEGIATDANEENPKGFWERRDLRRICDGLLQDSGYDWWKVAGFAPDRLDPEAVARHRNEFARLLAGIDSHRPWVLKEPRLCLLLPILRPALEVPLIVHVSREPVEVAASLAARNGLPRPVAAALWEHYTLHALSASAGLPCVHVRYRNVLADPVGSLRALLEWLEEQGVQGMRHPCEREVTAFIDPALHRQQVEPSRRDGLLNAEQAALAAAVDDDSFLSPAWAHREPSAGGVEALRAHEAAADQQAETERLAGRMRELEQRHVDELAALRSTADARLAEAEQQLEDTTRRECALAAEAERATERLRSAAHRIGAVQRSRRWRLLRRALRVRRALTPGKPGRVSDPLAVVRSDLGDTVDDLSTALRASGERPDDGRQEIVAPGLTLRTSGPPRPTGTPGRRKVAVLAWDVGHNPLGRAYILAEVLARRFDVEIWGAQFERYGDRLWAPLRDPAVTVRSFDGTSLPEHLDRVEAVAERIDADLLWVSKPRFPSIALGAAAKRIGNRPLVLDVDDHELAFFGTDQGIDVHELAGRSAGELTLPFERAWTQVCDALIGETDLVTVSNEALQARYGGEIVPHARDERHFDPALHDRERTRASLGVAPDDRLLLFGGTPRIHKGVVEVLEALDRLGDRRNKLALFGTRELRELRDRIGPLERWIVPLPYQRFDQLAPIVGAADLACVLQDPSHPVSHYQMPAKVTDALAMAVPCLVADVPPLRSLADSGVVQVCDRRRPLHQQIADVLEDRDGAAAMAARGREHFLTRLSYRAVAERIAPAFEALADGDVPGLSPVIEEVLEAPRRLLTSGSAPTGAPPTAPRRRGSRRWHAVPGEQYDLVVFWKQNDTSIYGRRQDMFLRYLARSGRFHRIVHFDNPITPERLASSYWHAHGTSDQSRLVVRQTVGRLLPGRLLAGRGSDGVTYRTFLHGGPRTARLGLPKRSDYPAFVRHVLAREGVGERLTVFWVYPSNDDLPAVIDALEPDLVVADVVDDNRTWYAIDSPHHARIERNYREVLARSDVVLANCAPVAESMARFAPEVHVVPNGCELPDGSPRPPKPRELAALAGPLIGYVGNLSARIDVDLLDRLASARPAWQFVFVGSAHLDRSILRLDRHPNVHFLGVRPYEEAKRLVAHFDVALIPHLDNPMTQAMNPLKAFVYCAAGVPVVSTSIANTEQLGALVTVAHGVDGFLVAIEDALQRGRQHPDGSLLEPHAWERRVEQVLALIDSASEADDAA